MKNRIFEEWFATFRDSINTYEYYTDFAKVTANVERLRSAIELLNPLVGSKNIERDFENILLNSPECLKAIPLLLGVRQYEIFCNGINYNFNTPNQSVEQYKYFMRETGLFDFLQNRIIGGNLFGYLAGVETGLDSNGRKNRGGKQMENLVEKFLIDTGVAYRGQMKLEDVEKNFGLDLSAISAGITSKHFDFVVKTPSKVFGIETNFYASKGSKPNETARSYKTIALESRGIDGFEFVWITDGKGWRDARNNLKETFLVLPTLYNIRDMENGIFMELFNE